VALVPSCGSSTLFPCSCSFGFKTTGAVGFRRTLDKSNESCNQNEISTSSSLELFILQSTSNWTTSNEAYLVQLSQGTLPIQYSIIQYSKTNRKYGRKLIHSELKPNSCLAIRCLFLQFLKNQRMKSRLTFHPESGTDSTIMIESIVAI